MLEAVYVGVINSYVGRINKHVSIYEYVSPCVAGQWCHGTVGCVLRLAT
jgi:hypothetical protein